MGEIGQAFSDPFKHAGLPEGLADCVAWEVLVEDSGADIAVVDHGGLVRYLSTPTSFWSLPSAMSNPVGRRLQELFPTEMAEERQSHVHRVIADRRPLIVEGMWRGIRVEETLRVVMVPGQASPLVLIVCRAAHEWASPSANRPGLDRVRAEHVDLGPLGVLTTKELEVLSLIGQGCTTAEIATRMFRSAKTIEAHRLSLGLKLKAKNRVDLARLAVRAGLSFDSIRRRGRDAERSDETTGPERLAENGESARAGSTRG